MTDSPPKSFVNAEFSTQTPVVFGVTLQGWGRWFGLRAVEQPVAVAGCISDHGSPADSGSHCF